MARTQEYTAKEVATALRDAEGVVAQAAKRLGCSPRTVYNYAEQYVTVEQAMKDAREDLAAEAETHLVQMMRDKDNPSQRYKAVKDILRNYHPDDWTDKATESDLNADGLQVNIMPPSDD